MYLSQIRYNTFKIDFKTSMHIFIAPAPLYLRKKFDICTPIGTIGNILGKFKVRSQF